MSVFILLSLDSSFQSYSSYSILPTLSLDGILHLVVEDHPYTAREFNSFINGLLDVMNPFPGPNSVIVMDNASIHKSWELRDMIERRCAQYHVWRIRVVNDYTEE